MTGLTSLGTALTVIFAFSVAALFAELLYVLYRRRIFRRQTASAEEDTLTTPPTSKELLYFLCWRHHQSRVEPNSSSSATTPTRDVEAWNPGASPEILEILKLQGMVYGPSRMLFTIKEEEEREASEGEKKASLKELLREAVESPEEVIVTIETEVEVEEVEEMTQFSTPCASPLYYTPSASPSRESDSERLESSVVMDVDGE